MRKLQLGLFFMVLSVLTGLSACGSDTSSAPDASAPSKKTDTAVNPAQPACDPADESEEGINLCIINSTGGGGTLITRQLAVPVETCL